VLDHHFIRKGDGIESAGTGDERFHERLLVLTG